MPNKGDRKKFLVHYNYLHGILVMSKLLALILLLLLINYQCLGIGWCCNPGTAVGSY